MKQLRGVLLLVCCSVAFMARPARADVMTFQNCPGCFGSVYTRDIAKASSDPLLTLMHGYQAIFSLDTRHFTAPDGKDAGFSRAGNFKAADDDLGITALDAPCARGGQGFGCRQGLLALGGVLDWKWDFTMADGSRFNPSEIHIGAKYDNAAGNLNGGSTSNVVSVPEPATILLLGSGLVGLAAFGWKRHRA